VGALAPTADIALAVGPALMVVYVIMGAIGPVSGSNKAELPVYLQWMRAASPIRPACEALCFSEFRGRDFNHAKKGRGIGQLFKGVSRILKFHPLGNKHTGSKRQGGALRKGRLTGGDYVLKDLHMDIHHMSCEDSKKGLKRMLGIHSLLAFMGLYFGTR
jgi:hypothetical protein